MALDPTARETNFRDSVRKYLYDNLKTVEGYPLYFRQIFTTLDIRSNPSIDKWIVATFGERNLDLVTDAWMELRPCTRDDESFFKLIQITDKILGYLTPGSGDGITRIPFYKSAEKTEDWEYLNSSILVYDVNVSKDLMAEDGTNFRVITIWFKFVSKI
jgi:hypothetical protein